MKKSPHRFSLFMCSCCSGSFSPRRRLHVLEPGSNWIELACGRVPIRLASQSPHLQCFCRACSYRPATFTENATAQRPQSSKWTHAAPSPTSSKDNFYLVPPSCYCTLHSILFLALSPSFQSIIARSCSQNVIYHLSGKQPTHYEKP